MDKYIAFISYRHRQPDQTVAIRLHRMLEHFRIPKDLRTEGRTRLGRVFRDEDELPLSTDLGESIRAALENSEFLIAVCTPEYPKSRWCMEELDSFIAMHGQEHVLAILAEGTPEESFPPQLLFAQDAQGRRKAVEPLAANVTAPSLRQSLKKLKTEKLRLIASMLDCPFDTLYQREKRYQQRRVLAFSGLALAVAAVFIGTLLSKNAQIRAQYEETRRNLLQVQLDESVSLTENARNDLLLGRRSDAVRTLIRALPEDSRPYDPSAEGVLTDALRVYEEQEITFSANIRQDSGIEAWALSADGGTVFTWDAYGLVRAWSASGGKLLWQTSVGSAPSSWTDLPILWSDQASGILCSSGSQLFLLSAADGEEVWCYTPKDQTIYAVLPSVSEGELVLVKEMTFQKQLLTTRLDLMSGSVLEEKAFPVPGTIWTASNHAVISPTGPAAAIACASIKDDHYAWNLLIADRNTLNLQMIPLEHAVSFDSKAVMSFTPGGLLTVAAVELDDSALSIELQVISPDSGEVLHTMTAAGSMNYMLYMEAHMACSDKYALVSCNGNLFIFPLAGSEQVRSVAMPGKVLDILKPGSKQSPYTFLCTFDNGLTSYLICDEESIILTSDLELYSFDSSVPFRTARLDPATEILTVIPDNRANELLIIRDEGPDPTDLGFTADYANPAVSPSGEKVFLSAPYTFAVLSLPENRLLDERAFDEQISYFDHSAITLFTSDEEHVLMSQWIISLSDGTAAPLSTLQGESLKTPVASAWIAAIGKAETAVMLEEFIDSEYSVQSFRLYLDGEAQDKVSAPEGYRLRKSFSNDILWRLGGNGLLLSGAVSPEEQPLPYQLLLYDTVKGQWCPLSGRIAVSSQAAAAAANTERWFALQDGNRLALYDPASEEPLWETETSFFSETVSSLWPSPDDRLLLINYGTRRIAVYRTADGQLLNDLPFEMASGYALCMQQSEDGRLYVFSSGPSAGSDSLILNAETGEMISRITGAFFVNLYTGHLYHSGVSTESSVCYPLYSLEDLLEEARKRTE